MIVLFVKSNNFVCIISYEPTVLLIDADDDTEDKSELYLMSHIL